MLVKVWGERDPHRDRPPPPVQAPTQETQQPPLSTWTGAHPQHRKALDTPQGGRLGNRETTRSGTSLL